MRLEFASLTKDYSDLRALNDLSFHVDSGEIFGFVGSNGAGKSTTMRIALGVLDATSGSVTWDGKPVDFASRQRIGYMPEERGLYPKMKVGEQLTYLARLHGLSPREAQSATEEWTDRLGIGERRGDLVQSLSLGNQQRVQLAAALVHNPDILILDEPFSGLDPVAVDVMSGVLTDRAKAGAPSFSPPTNLTWSNDCVPASGSSPPGPWWQSEQQTNCGHAAETAGGLP